MSRVKRYLEDRTDSVLDSVRLYGSAVIVPAAEPDPLLSWLTSTVDRGPYTLLSRTLETLETVWLTGPSTATRERLSAATAAVSRQCGDRPALQSRTVTVPPLEEADALSNWREALEDAVEEQLELLVTEWLGPYGLRLEWTAVGLCAVPDTEGEGQ